jgi:hypothetical protein
MKRNNSQSFGRKIKRGHVRTKLSDFAVNLDGTPKLIIERRTKRGRWVLN